MSESKLRKKLGIPGGFKPSPKKYKPAEHEKLVWPSASLGPMLHGKCEACSTTGYVGEDGRCRKCR